MWRKPDILVDCVLRLAAKEPYELMGQSLLDEDFVRAEGVTDFSGYACVPGSQQPRLSWPGLGKVLQLLPKKGSLHGITRGPERRCRQHNAARAQAILTTSSCAPGLGPGARGLVD
jgi:hypothetical protein